MQNYNPLEFKSNFSESRQQMISSLNYIDAEKAFEILRQINGILSEETSKISINQDNSKLNLWKLLVDLKDEMEKLNINCLFQSTMLNVPAVPETQKEEEVQEKQTEIPVDIDPSDISRDINLFSNCKSVDKTLVETVKEQVKDSEILITNKPEYKFLLKLDDIEGVIWITSNKSHAKRLKISSRVIPITESQKNKFTRQRTGYSDKTDNPIFDFQASYLTRASKPSIYNDWKNLITNTYEMFKDTNI